MGENKSNLKRIYLIDREIASGRYPNATKLIKLVSQNNGKYSRATFYRDIEYLRDVLCAPINYNKQKGGYEYTEKTFRVPAMLSSEQQVRTAKIMSRLIETIKDSPLYDEAKEVFNMLSSVIPQTDTYGNIETSRDYEDISEDRVIFVGAPSSHFSKDAWEQIRSSMEKNNRISFMYKKPYSNEPERRTVDPYQLIFDNGAWSLYCFCNKRKENRLFVLSSMSGLEVRQDTFTLPDTFDFRDTTTGSFGCYTSNTECEYEILLTGAAANYAKSRIWGKNQTIEAASTKESGEILLRFTSNQYHPILTWVLGWAEEAIPLAPEELVEDWKIKVQATAELAAEM